MLRSTVVQTTPSSFRFRLPCHAQLVKEPATSNGRDGYLERSAWFGLPAEPAREYLKFSSAMHALLVYVSLTGLLDEIV